MSRENNNEIKREWFYTATIYIDQHLGVGDKLIIRNCVDSFVDDYRGGTGSDPSPSTFEILLFYEYIKPFGYSMGFFDWFIQRGLRGAWADYEMVRGKRRPQLNRNNI